MKMQDMQRGVVSLLVFINIDANEKYCSKSFKFGIAMPVIHSNKVIGALYYKIILERR